MTIANILELLDGRVKVLHNLLISKCGTSTDPEVREVWAKHQQVIMVREAILDRIKKERQDGVSE